MGELPQGQIEELLQLLQETNELLNRLGQQMAEASGAHLTDMSAISLLSRHPHQLTIGELGGKLRLSKAATTSLVDRLEQAGHVVRVRDTSDRRRWNIQVTAEANALAESILVDFLSRTRAALADYTEEELAVAVRFLTDIQMALQPTTQHGSRPSEPADSHR